MSAQLALLGALLGVAVPLRIVELRRNGGPTEQDRRWCADFGQLLGEQGEALSYRVQGTGRMVGSATMFNHLARAVAILAFSPGGIHIAGMHFEALRVEDAHG